MSMFMKSREDDSLGRVVNRVWPRGVNVGCTVMAWTN